MSLKQDIAASIYHESVEPFAYSYQNDLYVRLRLGNRVADHVDVIHFDKFKPKDTRIVTPALPYAKHGTTHEIYQACLQRGTKRFKYIFAIHVDQETYFYSRIGLTDAEPEDINDTFEVPYLGERDTYSPPDWIVGTTYYQIFPERFNRSETGPEHSRTLVPWDSVPTRDSFYGGNIQGIIEKIDYIADLGVTVVYFTPVFEAPSNHKYDTINYFKIDPDFGTEDDLRQLVDACHARGMRVVLDAVFNHMGVEHPIFKDLLQNGPDSTYADWIYPKSWPLSIEERNYETFDFVPHMPKWRTATPAVEDYLSKVGEYWIDKVGIDGWRLDVSDEVEHTFWKHFRSRIKAKNPDVLICGEIWQVATPWLRGDEFDSVMNYPFGFAVLEWLAKGTLNAKEFFYRIERIRALYPEHVLPALWNLLDSHDTPRLLTLCNDDKTQARLASFLQFAAVGSPVLYYGDEVGINGGPDPLCRGGMVWDEDEQDQTLQEYYRALLRARKDHKALVKGNFRPVFDGLSKQLYGFVRSLKDSATDERLETIVCFVNNDDEAVSFQFSDAALTPGVYKCIFGSLKGHTASTKNVLSLPAKDASMWLLAGE